MKNLLFGAISFLAVFNLNGQSNKKPDSNFASYSQKFVNSINEKDIDAFVSFYADTVLLTDPAWGTSDLHSRSTMRKFYEGYFSNTGGYELDLITVGPDIARNRLLILMDVTDPEGNEGKYVGSYQFEDGLIVEQMDFYTYEAEDLISTPRFQKYFKKAKLKLVSIKDK